MWGKRGRFRRRPDIMLGDHGYGYGKYRGLVWGSGLDTQRSLGERAFAPLHWFRRLRIRWEIDDDIHGAFLTLGCALIRWRRLKPSR